MKQTESDIQNVIIKWRDNKTIPLQRIASCLVVYSGIVYAAVWAGVDMSFLLLPEDFGKVQLSDVRAWTYYPEWNDHETN